MHYHTVRFHNDDPLENHKNVLPADRLPGLISNSTSFLAVRNAAIVLP